MSDGGWERQLCCGHVVMPSAALVVCSAACWLV